MHELSVCLSLLQQLQDIAAQQQAQRVTRIELGIGPLSGIERDLLESAWPMAAAGSIAEEADLAIDETVIRVRCNSCDAESEATANKLICGVCGDFRTTLVSGDEMLLLRVELADTG